MKRSNGLNSRFILGLAILFTVISISDSCSKSAAANMYGMNGNNGNNGGSGPGTNEVWIQGMAFNPATITVNAGTTITWTNKDAVTHTVTSDTGLFNSGNLGTSGTFTYTFLTAGTYAYHCAIHTYMTATVKVN